MLADLQRQPPGAAELEHGKARPAPGTASGWRFGLGFRDFRHQLAEL